MKRNKLMLPILAVIVGIAASAFTTTHQSNKPYDIADYWYEYTGPQNKDDRTEAINYSNPQTASLQCSGTEDECAVQVTVTLDALGNPPDHPDFTGASFDSQSGFPQQNTGLIVDNQTKTQ